MGFKKQAICLQHASQVWKILEAVEPEPGGSDINCLAHDKGEEAWRVCLPHPGTGHKKIRDSCFISVQLRKFLKFVNSQYTDDMPNLNQHIKNTPRLSEGQIRGWRSSVLILPASTPASNTSARVLMSSNPRGLGQSKIQVITMKRYNTLPRHKRAGTWDRRSLSLIET